MPYHPEVTTIQDFTLVTRTRTLPPNAVAHAVQTVEHEHVEAIQMVLLGDILGDYRILDVPKALGLTNPSDEQIEDVLQVAVGMRVQLGQELARKGRGRRARVLYAPVDGVVVARDGHRIILQEARQTVEVQARIPGEVTHASAHDVTITGKGALIQCAWGNGQYAYRAFKFLPPDGFAGLSKMDPRISEYRDVVIISPDALTTGDLLVANQQQVAGVVAPCMPAALRQLALELGFPVLLTEGFGQRRPTELIYRLLEDNMGLQAVFDASIPDRWRADRPEIMIPLPSKGRYPATPVLDQALAPGMKVRMTRAPWEGMVGEVEDLPQAPQVIDNGLRVLCASVRIDDGSVVLVPLANLELLG